MTVRVKMGLVMTTACLVVFLVGCGTVGGPRVNYDNQIGLSPTTVRRFPGGATEVVLIPATAIGQPMAVTKAGSYWSLKNTSWGFFMSFSLEELPAGATITRAYVWMKKKSYKSAETTAGLRIANVNNCLHIRKAVSSNTGGRTITEYEAVDDARHIWDHFSRGMDNADFINFDVSGEDGKYRDYILRNNSYITGFADQTEAWDRFNVQQFTIEEMQDDQTLSLFVDHGQEGSFDIEYCRNDERRNSDPVLVVEYTRGAPANVPRPATAESMSVAEKLAQLKALLDRGLITEEEFTAKRAEIIDSI